MKCVEKNQRHTFHFKRNKFYMKRNQFIFRTFFLLKVAKFKRQWPLSQRSIGRKVEKPVLYCGPIGYIISQDKKRSIFRPTIESSKGTHRCSILVCSVWKWNYGRPCGYQQSSERHGTALRMSSATKWLALVMSCLLNTSNWSVVKSLRQSRAVFLFVFFHLRAHFLLHKCGNHIIITNVAESGDFISLYTSWF